MNEFGGGLKVRAWFMAAVLVALTAGCGSRDEIFGATGAGAGAGGSPGPAGAGPALGAASPFGFFSSAALINTGLFTVITGDAGTTSTASSITGFRDGGGSVFTVTPLNNGLVTGTIFASDWPDVVLGLATVTAARAAALAAFTDLAPAARPGGQNVVACCGGGLPGELGGRTLAPGIYYSGAGGVATYAITTGDLTLDAGGNANAVWVFQMDSTLTVGLAGLPRSVILAGLAQPKNVFWYAPAGADINLGNTLGGGTMVGTIISDAAIRFSTDSNPCCTTLNGRALVLTAGATMNNTIINVPAP